MAQLRRKKYRPTRAVQSYDEDLIFKLDSTNACLLPGQKGYVAGADTPPPHLLPNMDEKERRRRRRQCRGHLKSLLPIHEYEETLAELEAKLINLMQLIEERAPFLLQGKN